MSFTTLFKEELIDSNINNRNSMRAFLSAVFKTSESIHLDKFGMNYEVSTDISAFAFKLVELIHSFFGIDIDINISNKSDGNGEKVTQYIVKLPREYNKRIGEELGLAIYKGDVITGFTIGCGIEMESLAEKKSYLQGIMAVLSSLTLPIVDANDENSFLGGYHYEMQFNDETLANQITVLLAEYGIKIKTVVRGEMTCLYLKDSSSISDIAALAGATSIVLEIQNIFISRSIRNDANRQSNCTVANIDKTVEAAQKQYIAINTIIATVGIESLSAGLQEVALLRLQYPDYSLEQLSELGCVTKSGINHRMRKIMAIAQELTTKESNNG